MLENAGGLSDNPALTTEKKRWNSWGDENGDRKGRTKQDSSPILPVPVSDASFLLHYPAPPVAAYQREHEAGGEDKNKASAVEGVATRKIEGRKDEMGEKEEGDRADKQLAYDANLRREAISQAKREQRDARV